MAGHSFEGFVPKVEWRWDAIPSSVYEMIQKTLETGDVKYLEPLGLPEPSPKQKHKKGKGDKIDRERARNGEIFILNKYLDQVEVACKFATRCHLYERHIAELEQSLAVEKTTCSELRQEYQMFHTALKDMSTLDQINKYVHHLDGKLRENATLKCFMADFYRSHIGLISLFLDEEVKKLNEPVPKDEVVQKAMYSIKFIQDEFAKFADVITSTFQGDSEVGGEDLSVSQTPSCNTTVPSRHPMRVHDPSKQASQEQLSNKLRLEILAKEQEIEQRNQDIKQKQEELKQKLEPLQQKSLLLKQQISVLETAKIHSLQLNPTFKPPFSFPSLAESYTIDLPAPSSGVDSIQKPEAARGERGEDHPEIPSAGTEDKSMENNESSPEPSRSSPSPSRKKNKRKNKPKHRH